MSIYVYARRKIIPREQIATRSFFLPSRCYSFLSQLIIVIRYAICVPFYSHRDIFMALSSRADLVKNVLATNLFTIIQIRSIVESDRDSLRNDHPRSHIIPTLGNLIYYHAGFCFRDAAARAHPKINQTRD